MHVPTVQQYLTSRNRKTPRATGSLIRFKELINEQPVSAILNTGASITCVNEAVYINLQVQFINDSAITVQQVSSSMISLGRVPVHVKIGNVTKLLEVHVLQGMKAQLPFGLGSASCFNL